MKIGRILHQQMMQLRWHFLACLGLLMALPIEEGIINVKDGAGFYATPLSLGIPMTIAPLLAGLIACANVQADLDERRYIFWRSKPVGVKRFVAMKYIVGLFIAFVMITLPVLFASVTCKVVQTDKINLGFYQFIANSLLISLMTYSLCFFCNTLVRKTARAWLIGMAVTVFLLLVPFILPLNFKDIVSSFRYFSVIYSVITLALSLVAFIISLVAVSRNWHLQTNLKGLLWTGASLIFLLMLLFTRQVANIKVLDEVELPKNIRFAGNLQRLYDDYQKGHFLDVDTANGKIEFKDVYIEPSEDTLKQQKNATRLYPVQKELDLDIYPNYQGFSFCNGSDTFKFNLVIYSYREEIRKNTYQEKLKKVYLCGYKLLEGFYSVPVSVLDLSDCVKQENPRKIGMRQVEDKLVILIQDSFAVAKVKQNGGLELIDKQVNGLKEYSRSLRYRDQTFKIPLIPIQDIRIEERIKLSIDINYRYYHVYSSWRRDENFYRHSSVTIGDDKISFYVLTEIEISRFDIIKWDDEYIYCRFRDERPFTLLEQMFGQVAEYDPWFVQDGKLYVYERQKLMIFDVRSERIRKLGHFERISDNFVINDIEVLNDGNILMSVTKGLRIHDDGSHSTAYSFYLLKNPE